MFWWKRHKERLAAIFLLTLFSIPVILPLLHRGFFQTDDGEWMVIRFSAFHQALRDGQFPVRFLGRLNQEYGYPVANFLYPGFMYLAEIPKVIGFGFVDAVKIIIGLSLISSAVFNYLWLNKVFCKSAAFIGAIFYLYAPYHLWDVYKRGSVGEILALAIVPFILWAIEKKHLVLISLGIAFLILSHNTLAVLFLPIILCYLILSREKFVLLSYDSSTIILGLGLVAFFWLPAVYDLQYTRFFQTQVSDWLQYFVSFSLIGRSTVLIFLLSFLRTMFHYDNTYYHTEKRITFFFWFIGLISIFLAISQSAFLWKILPVSFIQFPFRFLSVTILCGAFLAAFIVNKIGKLKIPLILILVAVIFLSAKPYFKQPTVFFDKGEGFYATNEGTTTVQNEYMPKWVQEIPNVKSKEKVEIISGEGKIRNLQTNSKKVSFNLKANTNLEIEINTVYFPGWEVLVNNQETIIDYHNTEGLIRFKVKPGSHQVIIEFGETPVRLIADTISLMSLLAILGLAIKRK